MRQEAPKSPEEKKEERNDKSKKENIERACERLSTAYARAIDFRDYHDFITLFTPQAELDTGRSLIGREAIAHSLLTRPDELRSRHVITNIYIDVIDDQQARGIAYLTLYRHKGEETLATRDICSPAAVGHYEDQFQLYDNQWLFARRKLHLAFRNPDFF